MDTTALSTNMRRPNLLIAFFFPFLGPSHAGKVYDNCDSDSVPDTARVSSLTPNQFHKICPGTTVSETNAAGEFGSRFGNPGCGDGTSFSFFFSRPPQRNSNSDKILIEFMGGGACWDAWTCARLSDMLTFPQQLNDFVGLSCSEIAAGIRIKEESGDEVPVSMLCARSIGDVDFTSYNTIVVPYCTQDVHAGSSVATYEDGSVVRHVGAHNTYAVLRWVFKNFRNPSHIALTGCSAGGTILPPVYSILNDHYNSRLRTPQGVRAVQISVLDDSPVYLTPLYFLENALSTWNLGVLMKLIGFNYDKWKNSEEYPTRVWDHALEKGSQSDRWGFVSHTYDPVALRYYNYMSGNGYGRYLEDDDLSSEYWSGLSTSLETIQNKHSNVETFFIDQEEGHCTFGLYYPLKQDGFEEWASSILKEDALLSLTNHASLPLLVASIIFGAGLLGGIRFASQREHRKIGNLDDGTLINSEMEVQGALARKLSNFIRVTSMTVLSFLSRFGTCPVTTAYGLSVTIYFWSMIAVSGFSHPLNNPSLGPNSIVLGSFGINNPTLIVYKHQVFRLVTSSFLCSGVLTYLILVLYLQRCIVPLEQTVASSALFALIFLFVALGCNLMFALTANGASCSSIAIVLGLNSFRAVLAFKHGKRGEGCYILAFSILVLIICSLCFPFNNWIILMSGMTLGLIVAGASIEIPEAEPIKGVAQNEGHDVIDAKGGVRMQTKPLKILFCLLLVLSVVLLSGLRQPDEMFLQPYLTGCDMMFSVDLENLGLTGLDSSGNNGQEGRWLEDAGNNDYNLCAQFCAPHVISRQMKQGADQLLSLTLEKGTCEMNGYDDYFAEKTFKYMSYSLDVALYYESGQNE